MFWKIHYWNYSCEKNVIEQNIILQNIYWHHFWILTNATTVHSVMCSQAPQNMYSVCKAAATQIWRKLNFFRWFWDMSYFFIEPANNRNITRNNEEEMLWQYISMEMVRNEHGNYLENRSGNRSFLLTTLGNALRFL